MFTYIKERPLTVVLGIVPTLIAVILMMGYISRVAALEAVWLIPIHIVFVLFAAVSLLGGFYTVLGVIRARLPWWQIAVALLGMVLTGVTIFIASMFFLFSLVGFS